MGPEPKVSTRRLVVAHVHRTGWVGALRSRLVNSSGIGTLRETHLHAAVKRWLAEPGDEFEVPVDNFVVDIVRGGTLIEIQTRGFSSMRTKLDSLLDRHPMIIVHPIAQRKWIVKGPHGGAPPSRRKSPKAGSVYDVFSELVSFPSLADHPNLSIEVLLTDEEEVRRFDGNRSWRRRGWAVVERRLLDVTERIEFGTPRDWLALLPVDLPVPFTTADLSSAIARPRRNAQQMAYCLREMGMLEVVGKEGNALEYCPVS